MAKAKITNNSAAPQGVRTRGGVVYLEAGASRVLDFVEHKLDRLKTRLFLDIEDIFEAAPEDDGSADRAALKAQAAELGIEYAKGIRTGTLKALVEAKLAENATAEQTAAAAMISPAPSTVAASTPQPGATATPSPAAPATDAPASGDQPAAPAVAPAAQPVQATT